VGIRTDDERASRNGRRARLRSPVFRRSGARRRRFGSPRRCRFGPV